MLSGTVFSYKLRYIVGFGLVEMAISTNQKPTIYRNLYENTGPGLISFTSLYREQQRHLYEWLSCKLILLNGGNTVLLSIILFKICYMSQTKYIKCLDNNVNIVNSIILWWFTRTFRAGNCVNNSSSKCSSNHQRTIFRIIFIFKGTIFITR